MFLSIPYHFMLKIRMKISLFNEIAIYQGVLSTLRFHQKYPCTTMTSSNGNIFRVTGPLWVESIGHRWILPQWRGALMFSLISAWTNDWANNRDAVIWGAIVPIMTSLYCTVIIAKYRERTVLCNISRCFVRSVKNRIKVKPSWCMMTSSNGNIFRVTGPLCGEFTGPGEFPTQRPVTRSFDVFFDLLLNKRLSKQPWGWWFETLSWSLWRHCNGMTPALQYVDKLLYGIWWIFHSLGGQPL